MSTMTDWPKRDHSDHTTGKVVATQPGHGHSAKLRLASPGAERIPCYCGERLVAFVRRTHPFASERAPGMEEWANLPADLRLERAIAAQWRHESGASPARVGISVSEGIVRLSGTVETVHDRMALGRIAAAMEETLAIIDDLWVSCE
ncbi:MAG: BON domain-containing protein [Rhodospirillales bacterium]|nr:BON domain-containing protein [Rhodospirillales bacterium]